MEIDFSFLFEFNEISIFIRVLLAVLAGMFIGNDRSKRESPAGAKTHSLVCLGSTLIMLLSEFCAEKYGIADVTRMPAQVISGIGFLGAGMIMVTQKSHIKGLTSAAGIWFSACIGLAIGCGFYYGAFAGFFFEFAILKFYSKHQFAKANKNTYSIYIEYTSDLNAGQMIKSLKAVQCEILSIDAHEFHAFNNSERKHAVIHIKATDLTNQEVQQILKPIQGIIQTTEL